MNVDVVFSNDRVLVVDKPAGWLSVPSREGAADERLCLGRELERSHGRLWPVHRLDREATGLVLFARDATTHRAASLWFEKRLIHKTYEALTTGTFAPDQRNASDIGPPPVPGESAVWRCRMARGKKRAYLADFGKDSVTRARWTNDVAWRGESCQRWELNPETGRSHQLRFELARRGFPILGDSLYGSSIVFMPEAIALRAVTLDLSGCRDAAAVGLPSILRVAGVNLALVCPDR
jgi:tRNA pseudouridine32 synthase/23S rRNA pseudouridine746 synthase